MNTILELMKKITGSLWGRIALGTVGTIAVAYVALFVYFRFIYEEPAKCVQGDCENGLGTIVYESGAQYVGQFADGESHGFGTFTNPAGHRYEGAWIAGEKHGFGKYTYPGGNSYEGEFKANVKAGQGSYTWGDGTKYSGAWADGEPQGQGKVLLSDGTELEGEYERGVVQNGAGIYIYDDGSRYIGQWKDGLRHGVGVMLDDHGGLIWAGEWAEGEQKEVAPFMENGAEGGEESQSGAGATEGGTDDLESGDAGGQE